MWPICLKPFILRATQIPFFDVDDLVSVVELECSLLVELLDVVSVVVLVVVELDVS